MNPQPQSQPLVSDFAGDPDFAELLVDYLSGMPNRIAALEAALAASDLESLARLTHQLKGSAGGYGYAPITDAAKDLEQCAKARGEMDVLKKQLDAVVDLCRRACASR